MTTDISGEIEGKRAKRSNPLPVSFSDGKRSGSNTVFGDTTTGTRKSYVVAQFQYGIDTDNAVVTESNGGTVTVSDSLLVGQTGTNSNGVARIETVKTVRYVPGQEIYCFITGVFDGPEEDSFQRLGLFDDDNGFFLGYEGTNFVFRRRRNGEDFTYDIDLDQFESDYGYRLNPQKGNIYKISYGYLGFATISLEVMLPSGSLVPLSTIEYPNSSEVTHTTQTYLPVRGEVGNNGNTTNLTLKSGSICAGIVDGGETAEQASGRSFSWANDATISVLNDTSLVTFRNKSTFGGIDNKVPARLLIISTSTEGNKPFRFRLLRNATLVNPDTATWTDIETENSTFEYSLDAEVDFTADNKLILAWNAAKADTFFEQLGENNLLLFPGQTASFVASSDSEGGVDLSIRWLELF